MFWRIIFPLLGPMNATVGILTCLWAWNDFLLPLVILTELAGGVLVDVGLWTRLASLALAGFTQALERGEVRSEAEPLDRKGPEAEVAARLEQLRAAIDVHPLALGQVEPEAVELAAGHRDSQTRSLARILEREEHALPALLAA